MGGPERGLDGPEQRELPGRQAWPEPQGRRPRQVQPKLRQVPVPEPLVRES